jgi:phosphatidylinositol glycan class N
MLMAALSGTSWPKNSVGILPDDLLQPQEGGDRVKADLLLGNARSILEQFRTKHGESRLGAACHNGP